MGETMTLSDVRAAAFEEGAIGMAMVGFDGVFLRVNAALCELVGRSRAELLGRTWQSITHPDDIEAGEQHVRNALLGEADVFRLSKRYVHRDGAIVWILLTVSTIRSAAGDPMCLLTQVVDITEQRKAEERVSRLASIVESSDDAILSQSVDGTVLSWNRGAEGMYGYVADEIVGQSVFTIVPPERHGDMEALLVAARQGRGVCSHETVTLRKDNTSVDVSVTISPINDRSGGTTGISMIARDVTAQKRAVAERDAALSALEAALTDARAAEARSRRFLSDAAHHLRNPLAGIRGCAETLLAGRAPAESERVVGQLVRESGRAGRLVDRLLWLSRLDRGEPLAFERSNLVALCRDLVERAHSLAPKVDLTLRAADTPLFQFDPRAVREIVGCLLDNARRHAIRHIGVTVVAAGGMALVRVEDDGPGLTVDVAERAFEPFVTLDGGGGSGLGLTLARALARSHGGDLVYTHERFELRLPLRRGPERGTPPA